MEPFDKSRGLDLRVPLVRNMAFCRGLVGGNLGCCVLNSRWLCNGDSTGAICLDFSDDASQIPEYMVMSWDDDWIGSIYAERDGWLACCEIRPEAGVISIDLARMRTENFDNCLASRNLSRFTVDEFSDPARFRSVMENVDFWPNELCWLPKRSVPGFVR